MTAPRLRGDETDNWWNDDGSWGYVGVRGPDQIIAIVADVSGTEQPRRPHLHIDDQPALLMGYAAPATEWRDKGFDGAQVCVLELASLAVDRPVTLSVRFEGSGKPFPNGEHIPFEPKKPAPVPAAPQPADAVPERRAAAESSDAISPLRAHLDARLTQLEAKIDARAEAAIAEGRAGFAWLEPKLDALLTDLPRRVMIWAAIAGASAMAAILLLGWLLIRWPGGAST